MRFIISHSEAFRIEHIVRKAFGCDRHGVANIANADHLEVHPMDAAIALVAPLYINHTATPDELQEIEHFIDSYQVFFDAKSNDEDIEDYDCSIDDFIDGLNRITDTYYSD